MQQNISKFFLPKKKAAPNVASPPGAPKVVPTPTKTVTASGKEIDVIDLADSESMSAAEAPKIPQEFVRSSQSSSSSFDPKEFLRKRALEEATSAENPSSSQQPSTKFRRIVMGVNRNMRSVENEFGEEVFEYERPSAKKEETPALAKITYTPLEKQVVAIREKYPDSLLMVECGYRMRFFGEDATTAAAVLGVWAHKDHNFMVASVPTHRAAFHCRRLLSAGLKVAIVRQTETAAIRKTSKGGSSSQTFDRNVAGIFTAGTLVDDDDPAFDGLMMFSRFGGAAKSTEGDGSDGESDGDEGDNTATSAVENVGDEDGQDHWIVSYYEQPISVESHARSTEDVIDLSTVSASRVIDREGALVAVCVRAHQLWVRSFVLDTVHQSLVDFLDMLQPVEVVAPESLSDASREIVLAYLDQAQRRQPQKTGRDVEEDDEADGEEEGESATEANPSTKASAMSTTRRLMQRIKWLSPKIYSASLPSSSSSVLLSWNKVLSPVARLAMRGLHEYLKEFQLESVLESPSANIHDPLFVESSTASASASASASSAVPTSSEVLSSSLPSSSAVDSTESSSVVLLEPSFPLDGVTVRDLELFDSFSNANEALRGINKLLTYQQQYMQHQQHRTSHTPATTTKALSGGLFSVLDRCGSVYGRRTLKNWLLNPLCHVPSIRARQEAITWLLPAFTNSADVVPYHDASVSPAMLRQEVQHFVHRVQDTLKRAPDIEKMLTSLQFNRIAPSRLKTLLALAIRLQGLYVAPTVGDEVSPGAAGTLLPSMPSLLRRPDYLPSWLTYHIRRVNFQQLAKQAMQFDEAIVLTTVVSFAAASHTSDYDPTKIAEESLTGFFDAVTEDRYPALAALRTEKQEVEAAIAQELQVIRTQLRKPQLRFTSLRSGALSCIEHLIELPLAEEKKVPSHWIKMNSTKQVVRFHVPTVIAWQEQLYRIRDECKIVGRDTWRSFVSEVKVAIHEAMRTATAVLGALDAMLSLAQVSAQPGYVCPEYTTESITSGAGERRLHIEEGRHPVLEKRFADLDTPYLANDVRLTAAQASQGESLVSKSDRLVQIVTGPNLGGKSSYCRMVALLALLGQLGAYVPARRAEMVVFDNILTRMGSEDDLHSGRSTFLCELVRTNAILRHATSRSLVVIDELGRGTATHDGYAIAQATLWYLLDHIRCFTLFITHFPQIAQFRRQWLRRSADDGPSEDVHDDTDPPITTDGTVEANVVLSHMSYVEREVDATTGETEVTFLYKLVESPARGSFGINVARLAGIKKSILERAISKAREMQEVTWSQWSQGRSSPAMRSGTDDRPTVSL